MSKTKEHFACPHCGSMNIEKKVETKSFTCMYCKDCKISYDIQKPDDIADAIEDEGEYWWQKGQYK